MLLSASLAAPAYLLATLLMLCTLPSSNALKAAPKGALVVFGDSFSDNGNAFKLNKPKIYPDSKWYSKGRGSNGPLWPEYVAVWRKLRLFNRAYFGAGACASGTQPDYFGGYARVPSLQQQVNAYLARTPRQAVASNLHATFAGANDYLSFWSKDEFRILNAASAPKPRPQAVVACISAASAALLSKGARKLVIFNLHDMSRSPMNIGNSTRSPVLKSQLQQHNALLAKTVKTLRARYKRATIVYFNTHTLFSEVSAKPSAYGITSVTGTALTGYIRLPKFPYWSPTQVVPGSKKYMHWDGLHITSYMHSLIARRLLAALAKSRLA